MFFEGDTIDVDVDLYDHADDGSLRPLADAQQVRVNVSKPNGQSMPELTLGAGVRNLGGGKYRATFDLSGGPGNYRAVVRAFSATGQRIGTIVRIYAEPLGS